MNDLRQNISVTLAAFADRPLAEAALDLFETLGYRSEKRLALQPNSVANFLSTFDPGHALAPDSALRTEADTVDFLFQITDDEIRQSGGQDDLPFDSKGKWNGAAIESYLFLAVTLKGASYTRTRLSAITREVNRLFPMPAMLLFQHGDTLTLAIIRRRLHKRDDSRDVLERKVTLIKDIRFADPLRAHIEILNDLSLSALRDEFYFHNFVGLHLAWEKRLDTYQLNERFYRDVANWYFWALKHPHIKFPRSVAAIRDEDERDKQRSIFLIRLLTRLIFCWFLQEKRLIPRDLFRRRIPEEMLTDFKPRAGTYYRVFLQNLFFGTLNQEISKRRYRKKNAGGRDPDHGITNLFRYEEQFTPGKSKAFLEMLRRIPFVNGGLFDCLDIVYKKEEARPDIRLDDFSEEDKSPLCVPNELFFCDEHPEDLSNAYGDSRRSKEKVRGLIDILGRYKFTVEENTPLEEEIALDPELLGKVFENLLASYNEDTKTTARKALGAFYTPREIVSYMVDESLIAYLKTSAFDGAKVSPRATDASENPSDFAETKLRTLFSQSVSLQSPFTAMETEALISAIDRAKILDPACGSGAFPMGMLHRLVDLLAKLDPNNRRWKERQLAKIQYDRKLAERMQDDDDREVSLCEIASREEDVKHSFDTRFHQLDFARKLYLIENCIYGVDILPIACQIAKLRFFIALIVDQNLDVDVDNLGFRPLPNLETKIVAADTLIPIEKPQHQMDLLDVQVRPLRQELEQVRHDHFNARTPDRKAKCRKRDAELRAKIADLLRENGMPADTAKALAVWDPYDQNHHASFFDSEWMFGLPVGKVRITDKSPSTLRGNLALINDVNGQMELAARGAEIESGFDIIIGNPPYVRPHKLSSDYKRLLWQYFEVFEKKADLYTCFIERAVKLLRPQGHLAYIVSDGFLRLDSFEQLRQFLLNSTTLDQIIDFKQDVFRSAAVKTCILLLTRRQDSKNIVRIAEVESVEALPQLCLRAVAQVKFLCKYKAIFDLSTDDRTDAIKAAIEKGSDRIGDHFDIQFGLKTGDDDKFLSTSAKSQQHKPLLRGENVGRYISRHMGEYVWYVPERMTAHRRTARPGDAQRFEQPKTLVRDTGAGLMATYDGAKYYVKDVLILTHKTQNECVLKTLTGVLNSSVLRFYYETSFPTLHVQHDELAALPIKQVIPKDGIGPHIAFLVDYILWLNQQEEVTSIGDASVTLMLGFWDQLINGLVYELFFPVELHAAQIFLFDLVAQANLPALDSIPETKRLARLRQDFERLYNLQHPIRASLHALRSLETIRIIEGEE